MLTADGRGSHAALIRVRMLTPANDLQDLGKRANTKTKYGCI